jgi:hypothetical protein
MGSEWMFGKLAAGVDWIRLAQYRDRWWAVVNAVMNLRVLFIFTICTSALKLSGVDIKGSRIIDISVKVEYETNCFT